MEKYKMVVTKILHGTRLSDAVYGKMLSLLDSNNYRITHVYLEDYTIVVLIDNETYFAKPEDPDQNVIFFIQFIFDNPDLCSYRNSFIYDGIRFAALL